MYRLKQLICILLAIVLLSFVTSSTTIAHGGRINGFNFGIHLGYPGYGYYDPFYYPSFYPYLPAVAPVAPPVVIPSTSATYIQQQEETITHQPQTHDWFYCQDSDGYYPYVKQCPGGWLRIAPHPASQ